MLPNISKNDLVVAERKQNEEESKARKEKERAVQKVVESRRIRMRAKTERILLNKAIFVFIVMKKGIGKRIV